MQQASRKLLKEVDSDTRNVVLTLARVWTTMATDSLMPKDAAEHAGRVLRLSRYMTRQIEHLKTERR